MAKRSAAMQWVTQVLWTWGGGYVVRYVRRLIWFGCLLFGVQEHLGG